MYNNKLLIALWVQGGPLTNLVPYEF